MPGWVSGSRMAAVGLVVTNLIPLVGVLAYDWNAHTLLVVYWLESGILGIEFFYKIRNARGEDDPATLPDVRLDERAVADFVGHPNREIAGIFAENYGVFWLFHGLFIMLFPGAFPMTFASPFDVGIAILGLTAYHALSYVLNYRYGGEYERNGPVTFLVEPYRRVFVLHVTIVLGFFAIALIGAPVGALAVMVVIKTIFDFSGHWREHEDASAAEPTPTTS